MGVSETSLEEIRSAAETDLNEALFLLDQYLPENPNDAEARELFGWLNLRFADYLIETSQGSGGVIPGLWADADNAFRMASQLRPDAAMPWVGMARARRLLGNNASAWTAAAEAYRRLKTGDPNPAGLEEVGRAGLALTIEAVQAGRPVPNAARVAERALRASIAAGSDAAAIQLADLLGWQGLNGEARSVLVLAVVRNPDWVEAIQRMANLAAGPEERVADLELARMQVRKNATLLWYLGEALYDQSFARQRAGDFSGARESLDRAEESLLAAMDQRPDFAESCRAWLHLVRTARGWTLRQEGRSEDASAAFLLALEADPARMEPAPDPGSLNLGVYTVVDDFFRAGKLALARTFLRRVTRAHDGNADWSNNLAFACRELGTAALARNEEDEAAGFFEDSWKAYNRCVAISPEDVRLVNDRALIAVYYLDHDWELAESELQRAIRMGDIQLASLPADVTREKRRDLEEAVGDAWENLAYLDVMRRERKDRAQGYLANSVRYFPYQRRAGVLRIRAALENPPSQDR